MTEPINLKEKEFVDKRMFQIEKRLARVAGYNRYGKPMYDHHIIECDTRLFWNVNIFKKSGVYHAQVTVEFPEKEVFLTEATSLETLMEKVEQQMLKYEDDFKEWLILMTP